MLQTVRKDRKEINPMMEINGNLPEMKAVFQEIMQKPEKMFEMLDINLKAIAERSVNELLKAELTAYLGREKYQRSLIPNSNHRNGVYQKKYTVKNVGELKLTIPRDRKGKYKSELIRKYDKYDKRIEKDISLMFIVLPFFLMQSS